MNKGIRFGRYAASGTAIGVLLGALQASATNYQPASVTCFEENTEAINTYIDSTGIFSSRTSGADEYVRCGHTDDGQYGGYNTYNKLYVRVHDRNDGDGVNCQVIVHNLITIGSSATGSFVYTSDPNASATTTYELTVDFPNLTIDSEDALAVLRCEIPEYDSSGYSGIASFHIGSTSP